MSIQIKRGSEIEGMRLAGRLASEVLDLLAPHMRAGVGVVGVDRIEQGLQRGGGKALGGLARTALGVADCGISRDTDGCNQGG